MKKSTKDNFKKYFLRGLLLTVVMFIFNAPVSFMIGLVLTGSTIVGLSMLLIWLLVALPIEGYFMTKVVKKWVK